MKDGYKVIRGKPKCNHRREVFRFDDRTQEFCDICGVVYIYYDWEVEG